MHLSEAAPSSGIKDKRKKKKKKQSQKKRLIGSPLNARRGGGSDGRKDNLDEDPPFFAADLPCSDLFDEELRNYCVGISYTDARSRFLTAFYQQILPRVEAFDPELVVISAGFDGHKNDPLGSDLGLLEETTSDDEHRAHLTRLELRARGGLYRCWRAGTTCRRDRTRSRCVIGTSGTEPAPAADRRRRRRPSQNQAAAFHNLTHHPHHLQSTSLFQSGRDHSIGTVPVHSRKP